MNNIDNSGPEKSTGSMRRLLADGTDRRPGAFGGSSRSLGQYVIPAILVLTLLIGVAILAYSFGVSRGKGNSNLERDRFLEVRAASWNATATAQGATAPAPGTTPAAIVPQNSFNINSSIYGRIDKIDGVKVTVLLLSSAGQPAGGSTVLNIIPAKTQIWRNVPSQPVELRVGDTVLFAGQPNGTDSYDAHSIVVLPPTS
jgi:hypothetical protein